MTANSAGLDVVESRPVLICQGCGYAWEPLVRDWTAEHRRGLADGCPECGDWLYLGELTHAAPLSSPRRALP